MGGRTQASTGPPKAREIQTLPLGHSCLEISSHNFLSITLCLAQLRLSMEGLVPTITKLRVTKTGTERIVSYPNKQDFYQLGKNTPIPQSDTHLRAGKQAPKEQGKCPKSQACPASSQTTGSVRNRWPQFSTPHSSPPEGKTALLVQLQSYRPNTSLTFLFSHPPTPLWFSLHPRDPD